MIEDLLNIVSKKQEDKETIVDLLQFMNGTLEKIVISSEESSEFSFLSEPVYAGEEVSCYEVSIYIPNFFFKIVITSDLPVIEGKGVFVQLNTAHENVFYDDTRDYFLLALLNYMLLSSGYSIKEEEINKETLIKNILFLDGLRDVPLEEATKRILLEFK